MKTASPIITIWRSLNGTLNTCETKIIYFKTKVIHVIQFNEYFSSHHIAQHISTVHVPVSDAPN